MCPFMFAFLPILQSGYLFFYTELELFTRWIQKIPFYKKLHKIEICCMYFYYLFNVVLGKIVVCVCAQKHGLWMMYLLCMCDWKALYDVRLHENQSFLSKVRTRPVPTGIIPLRRKTMFEGCLHTESVNGSSKCDPSLTLSNYTAHRVGPYTFVVIKWEDYR